MRHKHLLYPLEQQQLKEELLRLLELDDHNSVMLHTLDNDRQKQEQILSLLPRIRSYFSLSHVSAICYPERYNRVWLSIIRHVLKDDYDMVSADWRFKNENDETVRTKRYYFHKKVKQKPI